MKVTKISDENKYGCYGPSKFTNEFYAKHNKIMAKSYEKTCKKEVK